MTDVVKTDAIGAMSPRKTVTEEYIEGFRHGDHARILARLTDDVIWDIHGHVHLVGKHAFDEEIENEAFTGRPMLTIDRMVEEGDTVVANGTGDARLTDGTPFRFVFCDVFTFRGDAICRVESYVVPVGGRMAGTDGGPAI